MTPNLNDPFATLGFNFKSVVEQLTSHAAPEAKTTTPASVTSFRSKAHKAIKDHPIAALGIAFGAGYLFMRLARR